MPEPAPGRLRPLFPADLEQVRAWRNHPDIRAFLFTRHEITPEEHRRWYEAATADPGRHLLVYEEASQPLGFVSFAATRSPSVADWGFYAAPGAARGTGGRLGTAALAYAFDVLRLHKVCAEVLAGNAASLRFHEKLGFRREGVLREQHFDGDCYQDVVRYGLLAAEWQAHQ